MFEKVTAVRFDKPTEKGRTQPIRMAAIREDGSTVELVVKFSAKCNSEVEGLAVEAIAAMLGHELGLPVPDFFLVEVTPAFIDSIADPTVQAHVRVSCPLAFGSRELFGFGIVRGDQKWTDDQAQVLAEIFAFDGFIANVDRKPSNPNCLIRGEQLALIDHEAAMFVRAFIPPHRPWVVGGLQWLSFEDGHVFYKPLKGKPIDLSRLQNGWAGISDARLTEFQQALPVEWRPDSENVGAALNLIRDIRANMVPSIQEVMRILAL